MISNNIARHRETFCAECGGKTGGGRLCDDCLPPNQSELEEQFDREHPIAAGAPADGDDDVQSTEQDYVVCPKCNKELRPENAHQKIRAALYKHLYRRHLANFDSRRDLLSILDELAPGDSPELTEDDAAWEASLASMGKEIVQQSQQGAAEIESEPAAEVAAQATGQRTVRCPLSGCSWVSSPGEPSILKRKLSDHLFANKAHLSLSSEERIAHLNREFTGVSWSKSKNSKKQAATKENNSPSQERVITCPCGSVMSAKSPKTKLDVLVRAHVKSGLHKGINEMQRYELTVKMLPSHKWKVPLGYVTWRKESGSTPISVHQAVQQMSPAEAPAPAATSHKTLLLLDGTNGFSFAGCGAFLERTMKPFLESRALRVEITDTGPSLRMTMEMRKEAAK